MSQRYVLVSVDDWRSALCSRIATEKFLKETMDLLDEAADTVDWTGPRMPWHDWLGDAA